MLTNSNIHNGLNCGLSILLTICVVLVVYAFGSNVYGSKQFYILIFVSILLLIIVLWLLKIKFSIEPRQPNYTLLPDSLA
jgi:hypothetical protein